MRKRATRRGLQLTELGLGTAQFGNLYRETTDDEVEGAMSAAWEAGIRYFDTAPHYGVGLAERRLGEQLRRWPRDEYVVSSKVGKLLVPSPHTAHLRDEEGFDVARDPVRQWDFSRDGVLRSVAATLERTGLDRIDIVYLHDPDDHAEVAFGEGIDTLIELREQGVVSAVGAGMNAAAPLAELIRRADVDLVMCAGRYTLLEQPALEDLMPLALERGVGVAIAGVYNSGLLGRARPAADASYNYGPAAPALLARAHRIADICEEHGTTLPAAAIAYVLQHPAVTTVVLGSRTAEQVTQNVGRYLEDIPDPLWVALAEAGLIPEPPTSENRMTESEQ